MKKARSGMLTSFCDDSWMRVIPLRVTLYRLYPISNKKEEKVSEFGSLEDEAISWNFQWRMPLFYYKLDFLDGSSNY